MRYYFLISQCEMEIVLVNCEMVCDLSKTYGFHRIYMRDRPNAFMITRQKTKERMNSFIESLDDKNLKIFPKGRFATDLSFEDLVVRFREWLKKNVYLDYQIPTRKWIGGLIAQGYNLFEFPIEHGAMYSIPTDEESKVMKIESPPEFMPFYHTFFNFCNQEPEILKYLNCDVCSLALIWNGTEAITMKFETLLDLCDYIRPNIFRDKLVRCVSFDTLEFRADGKKWEMIELEEV